MSFYSEEHLLFQNSIDAFCQKEITPYIKDWEEKKFFPSSIFKVLAREGYLGILVDEKWGGMGLDYIYASAWCEAFGKVPSLGFTTAVNMHSLVITPTLSRLGSKEACERWIKEAVSGNAIGAYAFTEPNAGSDMSGIRTRAKKDGNDFILEGSKIFITNGKRADFVLVLAKTDPDAGYKGFTTFVVDTTLPGFSVSRSLDKIGWHCSDTAELVFDGVRVPSSCVLGDVGMGWKQAMASLEWERLMLSFLSISGASKCLAETLKYVEDRKVFGRTVGSFPVNRELLISFKSQLESARSLAWDSARRLQEGLSCRLEVSALKAYVCERAFQIAHHCLQLHGGYGYTTEFLPERWLRDLRLNTIGGGTTQIMQRVIMKELWK
ncbi:MAG TPA: acyl-CoA dehydrogenase family protein [Oligoflexia bacterium]|nr:acyl-CoA dehydrogenase family protein [Oligoflexia bacterium]HMP49583.1 acyl-CoA dehydrogenase family protein [Oligoflexia bacterium]